MRTSAALLATCVACVGCTRTPPAAGIVFPGERWQTASPESQGIDPARLRQAIAHLRSVCGKHGTDETMIVKNGYVVWRGQHVDRRHIIWSCTKSFTSTCLGLLWDDGKLTPQTLAHEHAPALAKDYPTVTLRHLGTFTGGVNVPKNHTTIGEPLHAPGAAFHYNKQTDVLAAILTRIAGRSLEELFFERVGDRIGITRNDMDWLHALEENGIPVNGGAGMPASGVTINARGIARFGWLYCNRGVWNGQRLISERYIEYACVPRTSRDTPPHNPGGWYVQLPGMYGLNWWTNGVRADGKRFWPSASPDTFAAQGNKNNNCLIVPEWKLVVVRLGQDKIIAMEHYDKVFELLAPADARPRP